MEAQSTYPDPAQKPGLLRKRRAAIVWALGLTAAVLAGAAWILVRMARDGAFEPAPGYPGATVTGSLGPETVLMESADPYEQVLATYVQQLVPSAAGSTSYAGTFLRLGLYVVEGLYVTVPDGKNGSDQAIIIRRGGGRQTWVHIARGSAGGKTRIFARVERLGSESEASGTSKQGPDWSPKGFSRGGSSASNARMRADSALLYQSFSPVWSDYARRAGYSGKHAPGLHVEGDPTVLTSADPGAKWGTFLKDLPNERVAVFISAGPAAGETAVLVAAARR